MKAGHYVVLTCDLSMILITFIRALRSSHCKRLSVTKMAVAKENNGALIPVSPLSIEGASVKTGSRIQGHHLSQSHCIWSLIWEVCLVTLSARQTRFFLHSKSLVSPAPVHPSCLSSCSVSILRTASWSSFFYICLCRLSCIKFPFISHVVFICTSLVWLLGDHKRPLHGFVAWQQYNIAAVQLGQVGLLQPARLLLLSRVAFPKMCVNAFLLFKNGSEFYRTAQFVYNLYVLFYSMFRLFVDIIRENIYTHYFPRHWHRQYGAEIQYSFMKSVY
jgi:hypothetical protein